MIDRQSIIAFIKLSRALGETIKEFGPRGVPNGHLYAAVMGSVDIDTYTAAIQVLKDSGMVVEKNYLLTWMEPKTPTINPDLIND